MAYTSTQVDSAHTAAWSYLEQLNNRYNSVSAANALTKNFVSENLTQARAAWTAYEAVISSAIKQGGVVGSRAQGSGNSTYPAFDRTIKNLQADLQRTIDGSGIVPAGAQAGVVTPVNNAGDCGCNDSSSVLTPVSPGLSSPPSVTTGPTGTVSYGPLTPVRVTDPILQGVPSSDMAGTSATTAGFLSSIDLKNPLLLFVVLAVGLFISQRKRKG